jgi:hypothetical protein
MTPSGIEPTTFRVLAQCLNQLDPRVTQIQALRGSETLCLSQTAYISLKSDYLVPTKQNAIIIRFKLKMIYFPVYRDLVGKPEREPLERPRRKL